MPDTPANQAESPQSSSQKVGVGFPLARVCAIVSLATAGVLSVGLGPYSGKDRRINKYRELKCSPGLSWPGRDGQERPSLRQLLMRRS